MDINDILPVAVQSSETCFEGSVFRVDRERVKLASGQEVSRDTVRLNGAVAILPLLDDGSVLMVRQWRHSRNGMLWEIPAGLLEPGESPEAAAMRELEEEVGHQAATLIELGAPIIPAPGMSNEVITLFLARDLTPSHQHLDPDEKLIPVTIRPEDLRRMVGDGEIQDAKSLVAIYRFWATQSG